MIDESGFNASLVKEREVKANCVGELLEMTQGKSGLEETGKKISLTNFGKHAISAGKDFDVPLTTQEEIELKLSNSLAEFTGSSVVRGGIFGRIGGQKGEFAVRVANTQYNRKNLQYPGNEFLKVDGNPITDEPQILNNGSIISFGDIKSDSVGRIFKFKLEQ